MSILLFPLVGFLVFAYLKEKKKVIAVTLAALSIVSPVLVIAIDTNYKIVEEYDYRPRTDRDVIFLREDDASNLNEEEMVELFEKKSREHWHEVIEEDLVLNPGENNIKAIAIVKMNLNLSRHDPFLIPEETSVELTFKSDMLFFDGEEEQMYK